MGGITLVLFNCPKLLSCTVADVWAEDALILDSSSRGAFRINDLLFCFSMFLITGSFRINELLSNLSRFVGSGTVLVVALITVEWGLLPFSIVIYVF